MKKEKCEPFLWTSDGTHFSEIRNNYNINLRVRSKLFYFDLNFLHALLMSFDMNKTFPLII